VQINPGVVIGVEGEMWWSRETDTNEIIVVFFLTDSDRSWATDCAILAYRNEYEFIDGTAAVFVGVARLALAFLAEKVSD
jgi:hypothetical protein